MDDARKVQLLWDKLAVEQLMLQFGQALDRHDWVAYRRCFTDRIDVDFRDLVGLPPVRVDADRWTAFAKAALDSVKCLHQYTNHLVHVRGDYADGVLYMEAKHFRLTERGGCENVQHGWYENTYTRVDGNWKISKLGQRLAWVSGNEGVLDLHSAAVRAEFEAVFGPAMGAQII